MLPEEQNFADLIAAHEGLGGAEIVEQVHDLAIGEDALEGHRGRRGHAFQGLRVDHAVTPETLRGFVMQVEQDHPSGPQNFSEPRDQRGAGGRVLIIESIPEQHAVEFSRLVPQVAGEKARRAQAGVFLPPPEVRLRRANGAGRGRTLQLFGEEFSPGAQQVLGVQAKTARGKKIYGGLRNRA